MNAGFGWSPAMAKSTFENEIVSGGQLAHAFGVTPNVIANAAAKGLVKRVARGRYLVAESIKLYTAQLRASAAGRPDEKAQAALVAQRARSIELKNDKMEFELGKETRKYVLASDVDAEVRKLLLELRTEIMSIPALLRNAFPSQIDGLMAERIDDRVREILTNLAQGLTAEGESLQ
jgi:terminase small subunit / prophage DNA-packing protein